MINRINIFLFLLLPFSLVFSSFFADATTIVMGLSFIYFSIINKDFEFKNNLFFKFSIIWSLYLIFCSLLSEDILHSLESSLFYFRFILFAFSINYFLKRNLNLSKYFLYSLITCFILLIIDSLIQLSFGSNLFGYWVRPNNIFGLRISSFFNDEYILGSFLSRLSPLLVALFILVFSINLKKSLFLIIILLLVDFIVIISGERSALFYTLLFSFFFVFFSKKLLYIFLIKNLLLILSFLFILFYLPEINKRLVKYTLFQFETLYQHNEIVTSKDLDLEDNSFSSKFFLPISVQHKVVYETAFKIFNDNKVMGIGPKMFRKICDQDKYYTKSDIDRTIDGCQTHPHNTYIQLLSETGVVGTIFILILFFHVLYFLFSQLLNRSRSNSYTNHSLICLYGCFFITLWPLIPTGNFFHNWLNIIYFLPIGFAINIYGKNQ